MCSNATRNHRYIVQIVIFFCVSDFLRPWSSALSLYPFGKDTSDEQTEREDDGGSQNISLKQNFKFFGRNKSSLFVNNNGIITFDNQLTQYKPSAFPLEENRALIAPFWADVNTQHVGGDVWYRQTNDSQLLNEASQEIKNYFIQQRKFEATWLFISTWDNVGFYGASQEGKNRRNTFQAVLVSNQVRSFVIFNYEQIQWTTGSNSAGNTQTGLGGNPAQAGFNAGDGKNFFSIEGAQTDAVINLTLTSNVGVPGKWVFQVDGDSIHDVKCFYAEPIQLYPKYGQMLGGDEIRISGPCFSKDFNVLARIRETNNTFSCKVINAITVTCTTPTIFRTGELTLELNPYDLGWNYSAPFFVDNVASMMPKITRQQPDSWFVNENVTVSWSASDIPSESVRFEVITYIHTVDNPQLLPVLSENIKIPAEGIYSHSFILSSEKFGNLSSLVLRVSWNRTDDDDLSTAPSIWSDVFPVRWLSTSKSRDWCENWMNAEKLLTNLQDANSSCPCTLSQAIRDTGRFQIDVFCDLYKTNSLTNCAYYRKSAQCVRRNLQMDMPVGEVCCYDSYGELLDIRESSDSGGIHNRYHYRAQGQNIVPYFSYFEEDLLPYLHCCQYSQDKQMCQSFLQLRPPTTCQDYQPPRPAQAAGDPHLTTLDGKEYTFNGLGEFVLLQDSNSTVVIQVRTVQAKNTEGKEQNATVFSAVAMSVVGVGDKVEIYQREDGTPNVLVGGIAQELEEATSGFSGLTIYQNQTDEETVNLLVVFESNGVSLSVDVSEYLLNVLVMVGDDNLKGKLGGLLGNYNGNGQDDFVSRSGVMLSANASMEQIHYQFGMSWNVSAAESLFSLQNPTPEVTVMSYQPVFVSDVANKENETLVLSVCGDNAQCKFDFQVTGNERVARSTAKFIQKFKEIEKDTKEVIRCPYLSTPENGNKTVTGYYVNADAIFWCDVGFELLESSNSLRVCQEDGMWSGHTAVCAEKIETPADELRIEVYIAVGAGAGGGLFVIVLITVLGWRCYRSKKAKPQDSGETYEMCAEIYSISSDIPCRVFENEAFLQSLTNLGTDGVFKIPRPSYVDPKIFDEYFF